MTENGYFMDNQFWYIRFKNGIYQVVMGFEECEESFKVEFEGHYSDCVNFVNNMDAGIRESMF